MSSREGRGGRSRGPSRGSGPRGGPRRGRSAGDEPRAERRQAPGLAGAPVGVLGRRGRFLMAEPLFERGKRVVVQRDGPGREGDLVLLRPPRGGKGHARVERVIGRPDVARDVIEGLMLHRGLRRGFDPAVERAAREAADGGGHEVPARRDLRSLATFTIDPASARDFDDAISAEPLGEDRWRVWVHIADVTAYLPPGSRVDREAYRRATSVYVPGAVEPMLPEALSNDVCSLRPHVDRLAVTVEMDVHGEGVVRSAFCRSVVRSDRRLDYDEVDRIFAGDQPAEEPWAAPLAAARAAARALGVRQERGARLALDTLEPDFALDARGHVTGARRTPQTESHRLIEHLMIAANEAVAGLLEDRGLGALYRVHERPEPEAVRRLADQLASLEVPTPPVPESMSPQQAADVVGEISRTVERWLAGRDGRGRTGLTSLVLRTLKQAYYSPRNLGHAGLNSARYCHFTSPIRRYPDVVCHRALLAAIGAGEQPPDRGGLEEAGAWTSARERDAMTIERAADAIARCFLLERQLFEDGWGRVWEGEVTGVIGAGAFVAFGDGHEGLLPVRRLRGDWWELNEEGTILFGERTGGTIRVGDPVQVRVERVDTVRGRVDLVPARDEEH